RSIGMLLAGNAIEELDEQGRPIAGDTLLVLLNAHHGKVPFTLPQLDTQHQWLRIIDTISIRSTERPYKGGVRYPLQGRSLALFGMTPPLGERRRSAIEIARRATEPAVPQPAVPQPATPQPTAPPPTAPPPAAPPPAEPAAAPER